MDLVYGLLFGIAFGYILQRSGATEYDNILKALRLIDERIPKFMFLAVAVSMVGMATINAMGLMGLSNLPMNLGVVVGGLIFGVGFAVAGYCPGTVLGAIGEGKKDAVFTLLGALAGTLAYALVFPMFGGLMTSVLNMGGASFASVLRVKPLPVALVGAAIILAFLVVLDRLMPTKAETAQFAESVGHAAD